MDKFINTSIYVTYGIIAIISIVISYKVSLVMSLIVLAIETVRLMAIYKKVYAVIVLVFILNTALIAYNGYKTQKKIDYNNAEIQRNNDFTHSYLNSKDLRASTVKDFQSGIKELENISIDWWLLVGVYLFLEVSLILLIIGINKQEKQAVKPKIIKNAKYNGKNKVIQKKEPKKVEPQEEVEEKLEYVGSYREYAENKGISRDAAKKLFEEYIQDGKLVTKDRKKYLKV